MKYQSDKDF